MKNSTTLNPMWLMSESVGSYEHPLHKIIDYLPGTSMRFYYISSATFYKEHWHDATEIITCDQGAYLITIENKQYKLFAGDILIIPGGLVHTLTPYGTCKGKIHLIDLSPIKKIKSSIKIQNLLLQPTFISHTDNLELSQSSNALIHQMDIEYFSDNPLQELLTYSYITLLLTHVAQSDCFSMPIELPQNISSHKEYEETFNQILDYISLHYDEDLTLEVVAKQFGFSKYHFSRLFNKYINNNFSDYLACLRISAAKSMLSHSSLLISEIADKAGFNSLSSFNRVFKNKTGYSPSTYRLLYSES